ncbi:hypothetical protein Tco_0889106 [Tanacetum coccineum]
MDDHWRLWYVADVSDLGHRICLQALSEMCIAAGGQPVVVAAAHNYLQALSTMNIVAQVVVAAGEYKRVLLAE